MRATGPRGTSPGQSSACVVGIASSMAAPMVWGPKNGIDQPPWAKPPSVSSSRPPGDRHPHFRTAFPWIAEPPAGSLSGMIAILLSGDVRNGKVCNSRFCFRENNCPSDSFPFLLPRIPVRCSPKRRGTSAELAMCQCTAGIAGCAVLRCRPWSRRGATGLRCRRGCRVRCRLPVVSSAPRGLLDLACGIN